MPVVDILLLTAIGFGVVRGLFKGLFVEIATLLALVLGAYGAAYFSNYAADLLSTHLDWSEKTIAISAFVITFVVIVIAISFAGKALTKLASFVALGLLNKILGGVFGGLKMTLICSVFILAVETFNESISIVPDEKIQASTLYKPVQFLAPAILPAFMSRAQYIHLPELSKPKENNPKP